MKIYINYFKYVFKHKWYVMLECFKEGLIWRGLMHDLDTFMPSSFFPYARQFKGNISTGRDKTGYYSPVKTGNHEFILAWFKHQKINKHHWQYWIIPQSDNTCYPIDIPPIHIIEMLCDWKGAAKAQKTNRNLSEWYMANKDNMIFTDRTRKTIERELKEEFE